MFGSIVLTAVVLGTNPELMAREPVPASPMKTSFEAVCAGTRLRVEAHGLARPQAGARIFVNGRRVRQSGIGRLERDLTDSGAVYRLVALCGRERQTLQLQLYVGEADAAGQVAYSAGSATFIRDILVSYTGLSPTTEESFWFR